MSINDDSRLVHSVADLRGTVGLAALLFVSVFVAASFSIALPRDGFLAPVWIANAFILSSLLATRRVIWPLLIIVGALGNVAAEVVGHVAPVQGLCFTASNILETLFAALVLRSRLKGAPDCSKPSDLLLLAVTSLTAGVLSSLLSSTALFVLVGANMILSIRAWALAHALGLLTVTPCLLILFVPKRHLGGKTLGWRAGGGASLLLAITLGVFVQSRFPVLFLIPPALLMVSLELETFGAAAGVLTVEVIALASLFTKTGPMTLVHGDAVAKAAVMQVFLFAALISSLPIAVLNARRREAMGAVAKSEARYRRLADNASDIVTEASLDGRFTYVSPAVQAITGYSEDEALGLMALDLVHPEDLERVRLEIEAALKSPSGKRIEHRHITKDGRVIWIESRPTLARAPHTNRPLVITDVLRDITVRKEMELEVEKARAEAESAASVKSEFLANMSHELRTPLTSILGYSKLLDGQANLDGEGRRYVERVSDASQALLAIVNDILDFSKLEAGQVEISLQPINPAAVIAGALDLMAPQAAAKGLFHRFEGPALPDLIMADDTRIRQILLNLIGNALKFTTEGGVTVRARYDAGQARLRCEIVDTGLGIPADRLDRLFKRFSQVDASTTRSFGGTGLGLAICKGLAEAMGGDIGATSTFGKGSTFWLEIPCVTVERQERGVETGNPTQSAATMDGLRLLVADDNAINRELIRIMLSQFGVELTEASDGRQAVELANSSPFDIILMDVRMPDMDGPEAAQAIRLGGGPNANTPIVAFTADANGEELPAAWLSIFDDQLAKPIITANLLETLNYWNPANTAAEHMVEARLRRGH